MRRTSLYLILLIVFCPKVVFTQTTLTSETVPACVPEQIDRLNFVRAEQMDVWGLERNILIHHGNAALKWNSIPNWFPMSHVKHEFCGQVTGFSIFEGSSDPIDDDEEDFNHYIAPLTPEFQRFVDDARPYRSEPWSVTIPGTGIGYEASGWPNCGKADDDNCLEAEITPTPPFYANPWFYRDFTIPLFPQEKSVRTNKNICVFGPWIREDAHGNKPEIHPSELIWWKEPWTAFDAEDSQVYWLFGIQDDSNRFDREADFDLVFTGLTKPWNAFPKKANFNLAFLVNPSLERLVYTVTETSFTRNVISDYPDGRDHELSIDGRTAVSVSEVQDNERNIGVTFQQVCRRPTGQIQGYVSLDSIFGIGDRRSLYEEAIGSPRPEGLHSIIVVVGRHRYPLNPLPGIAWSTKPAFPSDRLRRALSDLANKRLTSSRSLGIKVLPQTLRHVQRNGKTELVADVEIGVRKSYVGKTPSRLVKLETIWGQQRIRQPFEQRTGNRRLGVLREVHVMNGVQLAAASDLGKQETASFSPVALLPDVNARAVDDNELKVTWASMMRVLGVSDKEATPQSGLRLNRRWKVEVTQEYAPVHQGRVLPEDNHPVGKELNSALREKDTKRIKELFGTDVPMKIDWSFTARDLVTGSSVLVSVGAGRDSDGIDVKLMPNPADGFEVHFPDTESAVYELVAFGKVSDAFGLRAEIRLPIASHTVYVHPTDASVTALIRDLAGIHGLDAKTMIGDSQLLAQVPTWAELRDVRKRRAQTLRIFLLQSARDGRITLQELRQALAATKLYASSK